MKIKKICSAVIFLIIIDQISKFFAESYLAYGRIELLGDFLSLSLAHNTGAGFSIMKGNNFLLIFLNLIIILLLIFYYYRYDKRNHLAFLLIIAGAMSNMIDRVYHGFVIDYVKIGTFPVFNIADVLITVGAVLLIFDLMKNKK